MNRVVHFEIHAADTEAMKKFYSSVFGWEMTQMGPEMGNYIMVKTGEDKPGTPWPGINGGITPRTGDRPMDGSAVNAFVCTIDVENIDAMIERVKTSGGSIALDKMNVPGVGDLVYCKDPEGSLFGMLQPAPMANAPQM